MRGSEAGWLPGLICKGKMDEGKMEADVKIGWGADGRAGVGL